ncbi:MAG: CheR family methyltransferase [Burkholderiaceae bacterium]
MNDLKPVHPIGTPGQLNDADFSRIRKLIREQAGIQLNDSKRMLAYGRLRPRIRELGLSGFDAYLSLVETQRGDELERFVNALTTNLTAFFREAHHFEILGEALRKTRARRVRIWCAAASTGEEPYSIAITCKEALPAGVTAEIMATDIDTTVLARARQGVYTEAGFAKLAPARLRQWFTARPGNEASFEVKPELKAMIRFTRLNLMDRTWPVRDTFDYIFCRNVLIYFDRETKLQIIKRMHGQLTTGGLLFVGHSENFSDCRTLYQLQGRTTYLRIP